MSHNEACHGNCDHPKHQVNGPLKAQTSGYIAAAKEESLDPETAAAYAFNGKPFNDPQEEYKNAIAKEKIYSASCPSCGYCPTCGRGGAQPYFPHTQPWPQFPFYQQPLYFGNSPYCGAAIQ
ncbi:MAG: hypothetical protein E6R03_08305 [Hyphomicrobiaceae bacterium]|nr:MAG: hypothetical protein E6R03_08305 [Hyphomicrobiaceae bacterium]